MKERVENLTPAQVEAKRGRDRVYYQSGSRAERDADKLVRGERIQHWGSHHRGMAALKARLGDPRPEGMTLSLTNWDGPDSYDGYDIRDGQQFPYRLSVNPDDYVWESMGDNNVRDAARRTRSEAA